MTDVNVNYENLADLAAVKFDSYIADLTAAGLENVGRLRRAGVGIVAICGPGRCGKDTAGEYLRDRFGLRFSGTVSRIVCPMIAYSLGLSESDAYESRHRRREFWFHWCNAFCRHDSARLVRMTLADNDVVGGIRAKPELLAARRELLDLTVWVEKPDVPVDPTLEYGRVDCDTEIVNDGSLEEYGNRLDVLDSYLRDFYRG